MKKKRFIKKPNWNRQGCNLAPGEDIGLFYLFISVILFCLWSRQLRHSLWWSAGGNDNDLEVNGFWLEEAENKINLSDYEFLKQQINKLIPKVTQRKDEKLLESTLPPPVRWKVSVRSGCAVTLLWASTIVFTYTRCWISNPHGETGCGCTWCCKEQYQVYRYFMLTVCWPVGASSLWWLHLSRPWMDSSEILKSRSWSPEEGSYWLFGRHQL